MCPAKRDIELFVYEELFWFYEDQCPWPVSYGNRFHTMCIDLAKAGITIKGLNKPTNHEKTVKSYLKC